MSCMASTVMFPTALGQEQKGQLGASATDHTPTHQHREQRMHPQHEVGSTVRNTGLFSAKMLMEKLLQWDHEKSEEEGLVTPELMLTQVNQLPPLGEREVTVVDTKVGLSQNKKPVRVEETSSGGV